METSGTDLPKLLQTILGSFIDLCGCDGGSIFTLHKDARGVEYLVFESMITRSIRLHQVPEEVSYLKFPIDESSLVGRTAQTRCSQKESFSKDAAGKKRVDRLLNYTTRNILSAPLVTPRGDLVGVVQLLNKLPFPGGSAEPEFDERDERLVSCVAGQAALAIENSLLLEEQERLLEGFVKACVTAVEARDPVTSGHSQRVAEYSVALAEAVSRTQTGEYGSTEFSPLQIRELRYAAVLHDIGKISVRENVLNKEKKLYPWDLELIHMRLKLMRAELKRQESQTGRNISEEINKIDNSWKLIQTANEPNVLFTSVEKVLEGITSVIVRTEEGDVLEVLNAREQEQLSIGRGSLTNLERVEIERHVSHTYEILKRVPWSRGLDQVPEIAYRHHEKLDGSGYPCRLPSSEIPIQSRILTICDIFDALTSQDRSYKHAVAWERAVRILDQDVRAGKLDPALMKIFVEARVFEHVHFITEEIRRAA
ncbi:HD domain-containing phosphohydrolase [Bdellovibrionota bacterium FG-2]